MKGIEVRERHLFWFFTKQRCVPLCNHRFLRGPKGGTRMKAVLFVDDHQVLADLSCEILEMLGYRAVSAYSGEEALQKFETDKFDILVTDFRMERMNGLELARKVHEREPNIPVIVVTGYGSI